MINVISDVASLTSIPEKNLLKLVQKTLYCINDSVEESVLTNQDITELDIGIGKLLIKTEMDKISYRFIPSELLEQSLKETVINKKNLLTTNLESKTIGKITDMYKELL